MSKAPSLKQRIHNMLQGQHALEVGKIVQYQPATLVILNVLAMMLKPWMSLP
jgi:hypothetical protein